MEIEVLVERRSNDIEASDVTDTFFYNAIGEALIFRVIVKYELGGDYF